MTSPKLIVAGIIVLSDFVELWVKMTRSWFAPAIPSSVNVIFDKFVGVGKTGVLEGPLTFSICNKIFFWPGFIM